MPSNVFESVIILIITLCNIEIIVKTNDNKIFLKNSIIIKSIGK